MCSRCSLVDAPGMAGKSAHEPKVVLGPGAKDETDEQSAPPATWVGPASTAETPKKGDSE